MGMGSTWLPRGRVLDASVTAKPVFVISLARIPYATQASPSRTSNMSINLMPTNGTMIPPTP